jgi:alpha-L-fucosidase 2
MLARGARVTVADGVLSVTGADSVTLLVTAATSYKSFRDVSLDSDAITLRQLVAGAQRS